jgi:NAD(P)-dependent dehydrogenase (short-subunit alcohol dehydrogenase family)
MSAILNFPLKDKHAFVTGGATGIGYAIAQALLSQGLKVTIAGRKEQALINACERLSGFGQIAYVCMDVCDEASVVSGFKTASEKQGCIDILINNAGQADAIPFMKMELAQWQHLLNVNLTGTFLCTQQVLPAMLDKGWGRIINIASTAGKKGYAYVAAYCAAKHGVIGLTRALALEVATKGVTVNAICPGYTETDMLQQAVDIIVQKTGRTEEQAREHMASQSPQHRLVQVDEVAQAVLFLCAPTSMSVTGQSIVIAGGEVM